MSEGLVFSSVLSSLLSKLVPRQSKVVNRKFERVEKFPIYSITRGKLSWHSSLYHRHYPRPEMLNVSSANIWLLHFNDLLVDFSPQHSDYFVCWPCWWCPCGRLCWHPPCPPSYPLPPGVACSTIYCSSHNGWLAQTLASWILLRPGDCDLVHLETGMVLIFSWELTDIRLVCQV